VKQGQRGRMVEYKKGRERKSKHKEKWGVSEKHRLLD
jgi:hypothetical protein